MSHASHITAHMSMTSTSSGGTDCEEEGRKEEEELEAGMVPDSL